MSVTDVQIGGEVSFVSQREDGRSDVLTPSQSEQQGWKIVFLKIQVIIFKNKFTLLFELVQFANLRNMLGFLNFVQFSRSTATFRHTGSSGLHR